MEGVGEEGKGEGQHCRPGRSYQEIGDEKEILVMDEGRFIEEGTYEELLKNNGVFAELISRQRLDT